MKWFKKKGIDLNTPASEAVEKERIATKEAADQALKSTEHLNELLLTNGFHIRLYRGAGGKINKERK